MAAASLREPKQHRSRRTLQRITEAGLDLITELGIEGTTVHGVVEKAESSVGSFYARFQGKGDFLTYLDERIWEIAERRWVELTTKPAWRQRSVEQVITNLAHVYAELELVHRDARDALALTLRGPDADFSIPALQFRARVRTDFRLLLLERGNTIVHPTPKLAIGMVCSTLEAATGLLEPPELKDLCSALAAHLLGGRKEPKAPGDDEVEFFDIWG